MEKDVLKGAICYLIGAIDFAPDKGKNWRRDLIETSKKAGLSIKYFDPTNKIEGLKSEVDTESNVLNKLRREHKWDEMSNFMSTIVRQDHRCQDISDFVIFFLDISTHTCGSYFELKSALDQKKPYFIIIPQGKEKLPSWLFGIINHNFVFDNISSVISYLVDLNTGKKLLSNRWVLIRKQIKEMEI